MEKAAKVKKMDYKKICEGLGKLWADLPPEDGAAKDHINAAKSLLEVHVADKEK